MTLTRVLPGLAIAFGLFSARAEALPTLQLDITDPDGVVYDTTTETIKAASSTYTLHALLDLSGTNWTPEERAAMLAQDYYISAAILPSVDSTLGDVGSFTLDGNLVNATTDMTFGTPPADDLVQAFDPGDLSKHGVFPTYFSEFAFNFLPGQEAVAYNTADAAGSGPTSATGTNFYWFSFQVDSSLLASPYFLHFDLYSEVVREAIASATLSLADIDVNQFAPFSHDAEGGGGPGVPEPGTVVLAAFCGLATVGRSLLGLVGAAV